MSELWSVAVDAPLPELLTYSIPPELRVKRGQWVSVPLGQRKAQGVLIAPTKHADPRFEIKNIYGIDEEHPPLSESFLSWVTWLADYYMHPLGMVAALACPPLAKNLNPRASKRAQVVPSLAQSHPLKLTDEQQRVVEAISKHTDFSTHLVFGVTGSGKTEVYLQLLAETLKQGKKGLVLVPEISLTPQLVQRFAARFGDQVAVLHSQLTPREKTNQWWDVIEGRKSILIGARSALFCPIENLGLIVVDEEHEPSYKQDEKLKYHGRDAAVMLAKFSNCPIVLGSATPSLETWKNTLEKKYHLHQMQNRVANRQLPSIEVIDLRNKHAADLPKWLDPKLHNAILETLEKKEQVALFLNRRGSAQVVICPLCGFTYECPNCDISLTLHHNVHLICHYCDYHENLKQECISCKEGAVTPLGLGTEVLEEEIKKLYPGARVARADRDEIQNREELEDLIAQMESHEIDILVGTQMIAKGLDFEKLTLVGHVLADIGFNIPDFRATERSFQLITQMSGRAGRHSEEPGRVFLQTYNPDYLSLEYALRGDFEGFALKELSFRQQLNYPPFGKMVALRSQSTHLDRAQETARLFVQRANALKKQNPKNYGEIEILGPAPAPIAKLRGQYRFHILLKAKSAKALNQFCRQVLHNEDWLPAGSRLLVDVDPIHLI